MLAPLHLLALVIPALALPTNPEVQEVSLVERQYTFPDVAANCPHSRISGGPLGPAYQHWQVTDNLNCGDAATCTDGKLNSHTFGYTAGATLTANIIGLDAGVTETWTSGTTYNCGETTGKKVCVWVKTAFTIYNVATAPGCQDHSLVQAKFPNKDNDGGEYYCETGSGCQHNNANYWE